MPYQSTERDTKNSRLGGYNPEAKQEEEGRKHYGTDKKIQGGVDGNRDVGESTQEGE